MPDRLFTPRFFVMCGFSFTVFLSAFQLLPTAPFHILALGGSTAVARGMGANAALDFVLAGCALASNGSQRARETGR